MIKYKLEEPVKEKQKTYIIYKLAYTEAGNSWKGILTNFMLAFYVSEETRFSLWRCL